MPGNIQITSSSFPLGFCVGLTQEQWLTLVSTLNATADLEVNVHIGEAEPDDHSFAWLKTITGVPDRLYVFNSGVWVSKHPIPAGFTMLAPAGTTLAGIDTLDGGEAGPVTAFTGPMWERDTDFDAMFPIGPGTLPSGTVLAEGATGGEEKHALTVAEMPPHTHQLLVAQSNTGGGSDVQRLRPDSTLADSDANSASAGGDPVTLLVAPHNTMPPYRVRFFIKKSARGYYRA